MIQKVLVTGGLGVLGQAVVAAFEAQGHQVALIARGIDKSKRATALTFSGFDLTNPEAAAKAFEKASEALGGADVLVNAAGGFDFSTLSDSEARLWEDLFRANLLTCSNMCRAAVSGLSGGGAIINVGAAGAEKGGVGMGAYAASKAGVARLTESLAAELGGRIRVNAVLPLILDTPQNRADMPDADPASWTAPAAVADAIVFLASNAARAVNGVLLPVTAPSQH